MRNIFLIVLFFLFLSSCKVGSSKVINKDSTVFGSVQIDTLFQDNISIRAVVVDANKIWYAADNSRFGYYDLQKKNKNENNVIVGNLKLEFRSIAQTSKNIFLLSVANPALLYKVSKKDLNASLVYQEYNTKVFYDSMQFWNDSEGIAIGDPVEDCLSVIITRDGGDTWTKIPSRKLPKIVVGEAAFAASNTNIIIKGNNAWIVSGGQKSRIFHSADKGNNWEVYNTPIVQGKKMTGIFTADFYDSKKGFIAGGDYEIPNQNFGNKATSFDGGKTWKLIAENEGFGYASCVQYIPHSDSKSLVSVGATGIYYSHDSGNSWKKLSDDPNLFTIRFVDSHTAIAAGKNKMIRIQFLK